MPYRVPRYRWPQAWTILTDRRASFRALRCDPRVGGHVDLLVTRQDAACLDGLAVRLPNATDPWPAARLEPNGRDWRALDDRPGDDALDRAFRAAERIERQRKAALQVGA